MEVMDSLEQHIPALIINHPLFMEDGQFQKDRYLKSLREGQPVDLTWLKEAYLQYYVPQQKLKSKLIETMSLNEQQVRKEFAVRNSSAKALVFAFPCTDYKPIVSTTEIVQYYQEHAREFERQPQADLGFTFFPVFPSKNDSLAVKAKIDSLYYRLQLGESFAHLANKHSTSATAIHDGDMGYVELDSIPAVYRTPISKLSVGQYSSPIFNKGEWYIYLLTDKTRNMVKLSEIALAPVISDETREAALDKIVRVRDLASTMGLAKAAKELDIKYGEANGVSLEKPKQAGILFESSVIERAIQAKAGYLFEPVFRQDLDGYLLMQVLNAQPYTQLPLEAVQDSIRSLLTRQKQYQMAKLDAEAFYAKHRSDKADIVRGESKSHLDIADMKVASQFTPNSSNQIASAILSLQKSESMTAPIAGKDAYYIGYSDLYRAPDWTKFDSQKSKIETAIRNSLWETYFQQWLNQQMKDAKVSIWVKFQDLNAQKPVAEEQNAK
jgi:hypothetical protein